MQAANMSSSARLKTKYQKKGTCPFEVVKNSISVSL